MKLASKRHISEYFSHAALFGAMFIALSLSNARAAELVMFEQAGCAWCEVFDREIAPIYGSVLKRCDGMADDTVRQAPEFRRLVDGAKSSLALIPKAIAIRDGDLLHRVLIELRSFDNLLAFRFG